MPKIHKIYAYDQIILVFTKADYRSKNHYMFIFDSQLYIHNTIKNQA